MEILQDQLKNEQLAEEAVTRLNLTNDGERATAYNIILDVINRATDDNCNVATTPIVLTSTFDTYYRDPKATTLDLDAKCLEDFEKLLRENQPYKVFKFMDLILGLMEYYDDKKRLNLIILPDALENNESAKQFILWSGQKASQLRLRQSAFKSVKVHYEAETKKLGILCDSESNKFAGNTYMGQVTSNLKVIAQSLIRSGDDKWMTLNVRDMPPAYQQNRSLLKHALTPKFPDFEVIVYNYKDTTTILLRRK